MFYLSFIFLVLGYPFNDRFDDHDLFVSVVEVEHADQSGDAEIRIKVFTDDLENALRNEFSRVFHLMEEGSCRSSSDALQDYFSKHMQLHVNDRNRPLKYVDCRLDYNTTWIVFHAEVDREWRNVFVQDDHFMELFPTQSNVVRITSAGEKRFFLLTKKKTSQEAKFSD